MKISLAAIADKISYTIISSEPTVPFISGEIIYGEWHKLITKGMLSKHTLIELSLSNTCSNGINYLVACSDEDFVTKEDILYLNKIAGDNNKHKKLISRIINHSDTFYIDGSMNLYIKILKSYTDICDHIFNAGRSKIRK